MPRTCSVDARLPLFLAGQDWIISRDEALAWGMSVAAVSHRLRTGQWRAILPSVYLAHPGEPSRRQQLHAALKWAGKSAAIDGVDACRFHGLSAPIDDCVVHVVVPWGAPARSRRFVVVRRSVAPIPVVRTELLRYVDCPTAVVAATRRMRSEKAVLALASESIQRRKTSHADLLAAHLVGPPRGATPLDLALADLNVGVESVAETDFARIAAASLVIPCIEFNVWLQMPDGERLCVDALIADAGLIHEVNGRKYHARLDLFEDMQTRHDLLTTADLRVLHNSPARLRREPRRVLAQLETCYLRDRGRGLPPGVQRIRGPMAI